MSNNVKSKSLKDRNANKNVFFRAFFVSFVITAAVWILLALIFSFAVSKQTDSGLAVKILSPVLCALSLASGGFAAGKLDKSDAVFLSLVLGCTVLGVCYGISAAFDLSMNMGPVTKTINMAIMLLCPVIGAKISTKEKQRNPRRKRKM